MKHIALILAVVIFAFSFASCGDLTYYAESDWEYSAEEFYGEPFDKIGANMLAISEKHGLSLYQSIKRQNDNDAYIVMCDLNATYMFNFGCEDLWCSFKADMYFFGESEDALADYSAQSKYVDFLNEVTQLLTYGYGAETNAYKDSFDYCMENGVETVENEKHFDAMLGDLIYGVDLNVEGQGYRKNLSGNRESELKCNFYHLDGLIKGDFEAGLAS